MSTIGHGTSGSIPSTPNVIGQTVTDWFALYHGDCCEAMRGIPDKSVDYSIFSPPFAALYTYSNSPRDIGNVRDNEEFFAHFDHTIAELRRVMKPGRNVSFHCMIMPTSKERDGYIGLRDFRGDLIRAFQRHGFIFHAEVVIWKDPVTVVQRTKDLGLLHKTVRENAAMSRMGIPDYLVTMRAPGECPTDDRVKHDPEQYPVSVWQRVASPVWMDINPSDTLQYQSARDHDDERHICPLQLEVIRRGVMLWTNPGDVVLSPFAGIGSEGFVALQEGRRFVGVELKDSYYRQAAKNLAAAERPRQASLFDAAPAVEVEPQSAADPVADRPGVVRTLPPEAEVADQSAAQVEKPAKEPKAPRKPRAPKAAKPAKPKGTTAVYIPSEMTATLVEGDGGQGAAGTRKAVG